MIARSIKKKNSFQEYNRTQDANKNETRTQIIEQGQKHEPRQITKKKKG